MKITEKEIMLKLIETQTDILNVLVEMEKEVFDWDSDGLKESIQRIRCKLHNDIKRQLTGEN